MRQDETQNLAERFHVLRPVQGLIHVLADHVVPAPAIKLFGAFVPKDNAILQIAHDDGVMSLVEQFGLLAVLFLGAFALGDFGAEFGVHLLGAFAGAQDGEMFFLEFLVGTAELISHGIKTAREVAEFILASNRDAVRKIAVGQAVGGVDQFVNRLDDAAREDHGQHAGDENAGERAWNERDRLARDFLLEVMDRAIRLHNAYYQSSGVTDRRGGRNPTAFRIRVDAGDRRCAVEGGEVVRLRAITIADEEMAPFVEIGHHHKLEVASLEEVGGLAHRIDGAAVAGKLVVVFDAQKMAADGLKVFAAVDLANVAAGNLVVRIAVDGGGGGVDNS